MTGKRAALLFFLFTRLCISEQPRVYTVCEVLARLEEFSCRKVRVKARIVSGTDTWLDGENCPKIVRVGGISFGSRIALRWPDSLLVGCNVDFTCDHGSYSTVYTAINSVEGRNGRIDVLIDGVVETRKPPYALLSRNGAPIGFGHLGSAAAQVIVKRVIELKITAQPTPRSEK